MAGKNRGKAAAALAVLVVLASGCNSKLLRPPAIVYADSGEYGVKTSVREQNRSFPSVFTAFLPSTVALHPGDAVNFQLRDTGEPHSIALGTIVDAAVNAAEGLGPAATLKQIEARKEMKAVPSVFSERTEDGVVQLNASAAERCFLDDGLPSKEPCIEAEQPDFDGTQPFFSSGVLEEGEPFRIRLSDETRPGSYRFMCLVHRSTMTGTLDVVDKSTDRPAVAQLREQADREQDEVASTLEPSVRDAATDAEPDGGPVLAATGPEGLSRVRVGVLRPRGVHDRRYAVAVVAPPRAHHLLQPVPGSEGGLHPGRRRRRPREPGRLVTGVERCAPRGSRQGRRAEEVVRDRRRDVGRRGGVELRGDPRDTADEGYLRDALLEGRDLPVLLLDPPFDARAGRRFRALDPLAPAMSEYPSAPR
jgi:plastocyanin